MDSVHSEHDDNLHGAVAGVALPASACILKEILTHVDVWRVPGVGYLGRYALG